MNRESVRKALSILLVAFVTLAMIPLLPLPVEGVTEARMYECGGGKLSQEVWPFDEALELTADTPTGSSYMLYDHHGGWWCDAEKTKDNTDDDLMCWAAAATNVLEWTGWGMTSGMWNTDQMFQYSLNHWDDRTGWPTSAWKWWFDGTLADVPGGGNFWPGHTWTDYLHEENDPALALQAIDGYLHAGYGVAIGIWDGGHVITSWGFQYDGSFDKTTHPGSYYLGVWVTDSDDDKGWVGPAVDAPNSLRYLPVDWNGTHWNLVGGYGGWHISGVCGFEPFPDNNRPVANAGGPYTGHEGSPITFDGSGSNDPDGDSLMYRWDFDNDGLWDTGWSSSPYASHIYPDDYTGNVVLQVCDLHTAGALLDGAITSVTVTNVPPTVDCGPDQTADEGYMIIFSGSFTDPGTNDTHTIEWDFGDGTPAVTGTLTPKHAYGDNGVYTVTLTVTDDDGGVGTDNLVVTVNNVAPTATVSINQPNPQFILPIVHTLTFDGSFTDPGWLDSHAATWDFGDGTVVPGIVTEENIEPDATGTTTADHVYSESGTYTVTLTITDDDGGVGTDTMQVIVVGAQEAAQITNDYIQALSDGAFKGNPNQRKKAFNNMFAAMNAMLDNEQYSGAIQHLRNNVREKTDGSVNGTPRNDWIINPTAQQEICMKIDDITAYLETFP